MIGEPVNGEALMTQARVARFHPWLLVVIVAVVLVLLLTVLLLVVSQPGLTHVMGSMLQAPAKMAPICATLPTDCP
jgi:hypothetical protein